MREAEEHLEPRVRHIERLIQGDGKEMGIGPLVLKHEDEMNGSDGLKHRVRKLEDQALRISVAVGIAVFIVQLLFKFWK